MRTEEEYNDEYVSGLGVVCPTQNKKADKHEECRMKWALEKERNRETKEITERK